MTRWLAISLLTLFAAPLRGGSNVLVYVGTYSRGGSEGIYVFSFDADSGLAGPVELAVRAVNPSFLAAGADGRFLYAVNEIDSFGETPAGAVSAFGVEPATGRLTLIGQTSTLGTGPAYISLDRSGRFLMVANYGGGSVAVFPIEADGGPGPARAFMQAAGSSVHPTRQAGPHAHSIDATVDNRHALVADLGLDRVLVYRFDESRGTLSAAGFCAMAPGAGPRHIAMDPGGKFVYVANEMTSAVTVCDYDAGTGSLAPGETYATLRDSTANSVAEIALDRSGERLYVSNRGDNTIVVFGVDRERGRLTAEQWVGTGGKTPRSFALDPTGRWLLAANQGSGQIALFSVDETTGHLTDTGRRISVPVPVCVTFLQPGR